MSLSISSHHCSHTSSLLEAKSKSEDNTYVELVTNLQKTEVYGLSAEMFFGDGVE